jgi:3-deoxy-D-manno-octulosonic-acid transferase
MGPSTFNFAQAADTSEAQGAAVRVDDMTQAVALASNWCQDPGLAERSARALRFSAAQQGAARRMSHAIWSA